MTISRPAIIIAATTAISFSALVAPPANAVELSITGSLCTISFTATETGIFTDHRLIAFENAFLQKLPAKTVELTTFFARVHDPATSDTEIAGRINAIAGNDDNIRTGLQDYVEMARAVREPFDFTINQSQAINYLLAFEQEYGIFPASLGLEDALRACDKGTPGKFGDIATTSSGASGSSGFSSGSS